MKGFIYLKILANFVSTVTSSVNTLVFQNHLGYVDRHWYYSYFTFKETEPREVDWQVPLRDLSKLIQMANG